jgi:hypothetical protein
VFAARVDRRRLKVEKGEKSHKRGKGGNGCEDGKRWNLLELSCACGREAGSERQSLKKSEKEKNLNVWLTGALTLRSASITYLIV